MKTVCSRIMNKIMDRWEKRILILMNRSGTLKVIFAMRLPNPPATMRFCNGLIFLMDIAKLAKYISGNIPSQVMIKGPQK